MSVLDIRELNKRARMESNTELNDGKKVYAMYKPMTHKTLITTDEKTMQIFVDCHGYRVDGVYINGEQIA